MSATPPTPTQPRSAQEMLAMARAFLARKGVEEARLEGELLVAHALGLDRLKLFMQLDRPVSGAEIDRARDLLVRRGKREPLAYITGEREFYTRTFKVGPGVLIPRPETELLVDEARRVAAELGRGALRVADLGTGSGCIAITLSLELQGAHVAAFDVSPAAILCAQRNAELLGAQIEFVEGDALATLPARAPFDLIVSNPPYVMRAEKPLLAPEVAEHEPELALYAPDSDPDFWVRALLEHGREWLAPGGAQLVELGHQQGERVLALAQTLGWQASLVRDLAGHQRVLVARPPQG
ncbi:MAG: peptide chain release factor N(5)-glutamine methyltransferase [Planctomycetes bacterium]|nr:peptide chain release factor N(5)-glutamine methyltransferase [Planctomycetota bacterium]